MTELGHNSGADADELAALTGSDEKPLENQAGARLRSFIERIERLEDEKKTIADDVREVYVEAKSHGFDPKVMREIVKRRKKDKAAQQEFDSLLETYLHALGMLD